MVEHLGAFPGGFLPVEGDPTLAAPIFKGATGATLSPRSSDMLVFPQCLFLGELCQSLLFVGTGRLQG